MADDDVTIKLRKDLNHEEYLKLIGFLDSEKAKDGDYSLLRIAEVDVSGNPLMYRGIKLGLYRGDCDRAPAFNVPKAIKRSKEVMHNLVDMLNELDALMIH